MLRVHFGYFNIELWRRLTLLSLCLRHVIWRGAVVSSHASTPRKPGTHYPHVTWAHVMLRVHLGYFNIEFWRRLTLLSLCLPHVIWRGALVGSRASTPLKFLLSHTFRETWRTCRVLFGHCYQFPEMEEILIENCTNGPFYMTPSHRIIEISIWEPTHGKK
jgi:hypothetical protein